MTRPPADLSRLPQLDTLLRSDAADPLLRTFGRRAVVDALRRAVDGARDAGREGRPVPRSDELVAAAADDLAARREGRLRRVVNATGVILHTNLGRAPLSAAARAAAADAAGYTSIEYDLEAGSRGSRTGHLGRLAAEACGAEAATVVNNGAAALVLVLAALSSGREAIVSRGELIEIGGSFRLPDVMAASGALLREVGTTNRTRIEDYRAAVGTATGLVLKVHQSNYRVVGFAGAPPASEVAGVAREAGVPFVHDLGSGLLRAGAGGAALASEPAVDAALDDGADLVVFSGDKLLGGPQAGVLAGRGDLVLRCERHPLARAVRVDKLQRAALEATLEAHLRDDEPLDVPVWAMLTAPADVVRDRARAIAAAVEGPTTAEASTALVGGGAVPGAELASWAVVVASRRPDELARALRVGDPPVVARVEGGRVVLDLRTVPPADDELLTVAIRAAIDRSSPS